MSKVIHNVVGTLLAAIPLSIFHMGEAAAQELESFGVIAGQSLTNTGPTTISGNIAISPGSTYTGSGSVTQTGEVFLADQVAARVQNDLSTLYAVLEGRPTSNGGNLTGQDLGGQTLSGGVYNFDTSAGLAAGQTLTLDGGGNPDTIFIFNIGSTLTTGSGSKVVLVNKAQGGNVFYRVGSSATLHTTSELEGQIVALTSITMNTAASINCGAAMARNGSVTLDTNTISICTLAGGGFDAAVIDPMLSDNERAVAVALSDYVASGGTLPLEVAILAATQTPAELATSLSQLSGEVSNGVAPTGMQAMNDFLDTVMRSGHGPRITAQPVRNDGAPIGMVREKINQAYSGKYGSEPTRDVETMSYSQTVAPHSQNWDMWATGYGSRVVIDGDAGLGYHGRKSDNKGIAVGLNLSPSEGTSYGVALALSTAGFALENGMGSGSSETVFLGLRGRTSSERGYVEGGLAFGRSDISTERSVTFAGMNRYAAKTTANSLAAHIEAGYHIGAFTPFVGVRAQSLDIPAYSETTVAGTSNYALMYDAETATSVRSELGVDMEWSKALSLGRATSFGVRAAWAHEFATNDPSTRSFVTRPGAMFPVTGATQDRDFLILAVNVGLVATNGFNIDGGLNMERSSNSRDHGASVTLGYRW